MQIKTLSVVFEFMLIVAIKWIHKAGKVAKQKITIVTLTREVEQVWRDSVGLIFTKHYKLQKINNTVRYKSNSDTDDQAVRP